MNIRKVPEKILQQEAFLIILSPKKWPIIRKRRSVDTQSLSEELKKAARALVPTGALC